MSDSIDFRIIFVAACSSLITLLVLHIFNNYESIYVQFKEYTAKQPNRDAQLCSKVSIANRIIRQRKDTISVSESSMSLLCKDMITKEFYAHEKIKDYFETDQYLNMIPNDPNWVNRKIELLLPDAQNYNEQLHQIMLDHFDVINIEPKSNIYVQQIKECIHMFNKWRKWPNNLNGWQFRKKTKQNMVVYTHSTLQYTLDIVKAEKIFPFSVPVIIGVFFNVHHVQKIDPSIKEINIVGNPSSTCSIIHLLVKCPPFIADRDFLNFACVYLFKDGSVLVLNTKCNETSLAPIRKDYIRGEIVLSIYHIRPNYDGNRNESNVTFYSLIDIKGSIPSWILNNAYMETAKALQNLENCIQSLYDTNVIHKPGELWIPPNPLLKMMGVDSK